MADSQKYINDGNQSNKSLLTSLSKNKYFHYKDNSELHCENISINAIADAVGTPFFVYSRKYFIDKYQVMKQALAGCNFKIYYAVKSNYNINIIQLLHKLGAGADVNSLGEMYRALKAGVPAGDILLGGVGKSGEEIAFALKNDIFLFKVESESELLLINETARDLGKIARVALRVNPDVDPLTHPYISTGLAENKFGIPFDEAESIYLNSKLSNILFTGIDMHIGSQIFSIAPYKEAIGKILNLCSRLKEAGINLHHIDIGGGYGIDYSGGEDFEFSTFANEIIPMLKESGLTVFLEPGRYFSANSGALITKVLYLKKNGDKNFIIIDAGMSELIRPSLYDSYHEIIPLVYSATGKKTYDVVGPLCESGDFLGKDLSIAEPAPSDLLAILSAGAYGMVMSSNYNARMRPPEVLVDDDHLQIIRKRETLEQLIQNEELI